MQVHPDSPATCTRYRTVDTYLSQEGAAGMEFDEAGNLWVVDMNNGLMWRLNVEDPTFVDVPWLDPNQDAATLKPGGSKTFKVKVQGSLSTQGANAATLLFDSDAGRASRTDPPVDLTRWAR